MELQGETTTTQQKPIKTKIISEKLFKDSHIDIVFVTVVNRKNKSEILNHVVYITFLSKSPSENSVNALHSVLKMKSQQLANFNLYFDMLSLGINNLSLARKQQEFTIEMTQKYPNTIKKVSIVAPAMLTPLINILFNVGNNGSIKSELRSFTNSAEAWTFVER